jgi:succinate dehydrogenase/fumarate reductase flavoprotein subunit
MSKCDVLVVAAGPAGCSAAFFLKYYDREDKVNVTLIDRLSEEKFHKYHRMCGEAKVKTVSRNCHQLKLRIL